MTIKEIQEELIDEFAMFDDWMQKYEYMIDLGKSLPLIDQDLKTDNKLIKGCQSKVWLQSELKEGEIIFTADSDAIITKGIVAILIRVFSNQTPDAIVASNTDFIAGNESYIFKRTFANHTHWNSIHCIDLWY